MQYCEGQFLAVAARHGLCRPASAALTLEDVLRLHSAPVGACLLSSVALWREQRLR